MSVLRVEQVGKKVDGSYFNPGPLDSDNIVLVTGSSNPQLAFKVGEMLGLETDLAVSRFPDGEADVQIGPRLDRRDVFIIQSTSPPNVDGYIIELCLMIDAARRASASNITAFIPYFGYSRGDRKNKPRIPIAAALVASLLKTAGADRIIATDIHSDQQQGFYSGPYDSLQLSYVFLPEIKKTGLDNLVVVSPDQGGVRRALAWAGYMKTDSVAVVVKRRDIDLHDRSEALLLIGEVKERDALLVDDMYSSFGTMAGAANLLHRKGARRIIALAGHGIFTGNALNRLDNSLIEQAWVTDTIAHSDKVLTDGKIRVVSAAPLIAESIYRIHTEQGLSDLFLS